MSHPYLSLVIPTRNDDYPSNVLPVQNKCLSILQRQLEAARIVSEIIVVEYNPSPAKPHLYESLQVDLGEYVTIRVISVDPKYHRRFQYWEKRPFHQSHAVNIGLRRARGRFFVYRAADQFYSDGLIRFLARKTLLEDCIYRCDRLDFDKAAMDAIQPDLPGEVTGICEKHVVEWHKPLHVPPYYHIPTLHSNACGDFLLMSRDAWMKVAGLREGRRPIFLDYDSLVLHASHALGNCEIILPNDCRVYKLNHGMKTVARIRQEWRPHWSRLERLWMRIGSNTAANLSRGIFNYPRRRDRTFDQVLLDSYERNFLLRAQLWSHHIGFLRQNYGKWGLAGESLSEHVIASGNWEAPERPEPAWQTAPAGTRATG